jgi:glutamate--cysteine ligase
VRAALQDQELLWPLSFPPLLPREIDKLPVSKTKESQRDYYANWKASHDVQQALPNGVHVNISLNDGLLESLYVYSADEYENFAAFKNAVYTKIIHGFIRQRWLITYLFGASPITEAGFYENIAPDHPVRSLRSSEKFGLFSRVKPDYTNVTQYAKHLQTAIANGDLSAESEMHGPVRIKNIHGTDHLLDEGVDYIELRMLDLDPSSSIGIRNSTVRFIRLLTMYFLMTPVNWDDDSQAKASEMNEQVAMEPANGTTKYREEALTFFDNLLAFTQRIGISVNVLRTVEELRQRVLRPELTLSGQLLELMNDGSLLDYGLERAHMYQADAEEMVKTLRVYKKSLDGQYVTDEDLKGWLLDQAWKHTEFPAEIK